MKKAGSKTKPLIKEAKPTRYSHTTASELRSVAIFWGLMDYNHIKGKPEVMDKNPNDDGVFEFTLADGTPIGKFAVQIKTLNKRNYKDPKYQCKVGFLAYCYRTNLPVILIAVNQEKCIVHWRLIDPGTLDEAQYNINGQSVMISFPPENTIALGQKEYIAAWQNIVQQDVLLRRNADERKRAHEQLESDFFQLREQLSPPTTLDKEEIAAFQRYLDEINTILDQEFPALKAVAYPDYWKIGVAVANTDFGRLSHFLIPIAYGSSELLVREFNIINEQDINEAFNQKGAFVLIGGNTETIEDLNKINAYGAIKSNLLHAFKNAPLYSSDLALANEYLAGFTATFYTLLGMNRKDDNISIKELQYLLTAVLPVAHENEFNYIAEGTTELYYGIDQHKDHKPTLYFKRRIDQSKEMLKGGYLPRYRTQIYSNLFYIPLVQRYLTLLLENGQTELGQIYASDPLLHSHVPLHVGIRNLPLIRENFRRFFERFLNSYEAYLSANFSSVANKVDFFEGASLLVFVLQTIGRAADKPYLEYYRIHDERLGKRRILFYDDMDKDNPMDRKRWLINRDPTCEIYGQVYAITSVTAMTLDFLFERSPTYAFINKQILKRLDSYLDKKVARKI